MDILNWILAAISALGLLETLAQPTFHCQPGEVAVEVTAPDGKPDTVCRTPDATMPATEDSERSEPVRGSLGQPQGQPQ